jgi:hypothetical protein
VTCRKQTVQPSLLKIHVTLCYDHISCDEKSHRIFIQDGLYKKIGILDYKDISNNLVLVNGAYIKNEHEHPFTILSVMFEK